MEGATVARLHDQVAGPTVSVRIAVRDRAVGLDARLFSQDMGVFVDGVCVGSTTSVQEGGGIRKDHVQDLRWGG